LISFPFGGADFDTDHYLVVAKVRQRLSISKWETTRKANCWSGEI